MRNNHWKLIPMFLLGLLVMLAVGCCVGVVFQDQEALHKLHWGIWLALTVGAPILAFVLYSKADGVPGLYLASYLVNAIGGGCAYGTVLGFMEVDFSRPMVGMLPGLAVPAVLALVMGLCFTLSRRYKTLAITFTVLGVAAVIASLVLGKGHADAAFGSMFGCLFFLALPLACAKTLCGSDSWLERLALSGFGTYLVVLVAAVCLLLEDGPDGLVEGLFDGVADVGSSLPPDRKRKY